jgi:histidine triad (HIT) family protein
MASIFTRIVRGEIPSARVYEDDLTFAFLDIHPASRGHTLVIPKQEYPDLLSMPAELLTAVHLTTQRVARAIQRALQPNGLNIVQNNGGAAGQTVFHYHVHLIPRWNGDHVLAPWKPHTTAPEEIQALAAQIQAAVGTDN